MKLISIKIKKHYLFKDTTLDFTIPGTELPADFILFAGENGTGKTQLLLLIYYITKFKIPTNLFECYFKLDILIENYEITSFALRSDSFQSLMNYQNQKCLIHIIKNPKTDQIIIDIPLLKKKFPLPLLTKDDIKTLKSIIGIQFLDNTNNLIPDRSVNVFSESIIIGEKSLKSDDTYLKRIASDYFSDINDRRFLESIDRRKAITKFDRKIYRGQTTQYSTMKGDVRLPFAFFTINKCFKKIKSRLRLVVDADRSEVYFTKDGKQLFSFTQLSAGEKRIISINNISSVVGHNKGNPILIDEPEIGLHPNWQKDLILLLKEYCTDHQFFISTHSPYILLDDSTISKTIISAQIRGKKNYFSKNLDIESYSAKEDIAITTFKLKDIFKVSDKPLILVEGRSDQILFNHLVTILKISDLEIQWIGSFNVNSNQEEFSGEDNMKWLLKSIKHNPNLINRKICCIFDNDSKIQSEQVAPKLFQFKLMDNSNSHFHKGIESLFDTDHCFDFAKFIKVKSFNNGLVTKSEIDKISLAKELIKLENSLFFKICKNLETSINDFLKFINNDQKTFSLTTKSDKSP